MPVTEFHGVTSGSRHGVRPGIGLYEFTLTNGAPVRVHDTSLRRLVWEPGASAALALVFEWAHGWVPPELEGTPFVIMQFAGVRIRRWDEDDQPLVLHAGRREDPSGQVSYFDWDGRSLFDLATLNCTLSFTADSVTVAASATGDAPRR